MNTMDIIKSAEAKDASGIQDTVNKVLSTKAFEKLEGMKREFASNLLKPEAKVEGEDQ